MAKKARTGGGGTAPNDTAQDVQLATRSSHSKPAPDQWARITMQALNSRAMTCLNIYGPFRRAVKGRVKRH